MIFVFLKKKKDYETYYYFPRYRRYTLHLL